MYSQESHLPAGSADHSSQESEGEEDQNVHSSLNFKQSPDPSQHTASVPLQKRRRVTRACDECRRKKIKCDGKQPCTHCTVYSYDCTYNQPSNRRRNPAPQYIEALETRLQRAEALLKTTLPNVNLNDPNIDTLIQKRQADAKDNISSDEKPVEVRNTSDDEAQLKSMIQSTGELELDDSGNWNFNGGSSGIVFMGRMREQFGSLLGDYHGKPFLPRLPRPKPPLGPMYDSPRSAIDSPMDVGIPNTLDLPPRDIALALCVNSLECGCSLMRFVHQPTFYEMFNRMYTIPPENFEDEENRFLPLLYVVLALGCMFHVEPLEEHESDATGYRSGIDQGLRYFRSARAMMDITDCRDITSLQAILFMILFLQSSSNLSTCYSYIGVALRCSLRMGLHRNLTGAFNPIEQETRRRVFWIVRKMDTYVSALLGLPQLLSNDDVDQELPLEIDDVYITKDGIHPMPPGTTSLYAASNAHTGLMEILSKVVKYIYPTKGNIEPSTQGTTTTPYMISHRKIREIEQDLAEWLDKLPLALRPGGEGSAEVLRAQQLLRLAYAHVQMMLYRPFLHYVSQKACANKKTDDRSYACAAAGVSVARNIVHITAEMKKRGLLVGAFWFTMYTTFFAILSLVFFVLENPDKPGSQEILADAIDGKEALKGLAKRSQAADRCSTALLTLFEQLPPRLLNGLPSGKGIKKRSAPSPSKYPPAPRSTHSASELSKQEEAPEMGISRARTFPMPAPVRSYSIARGSLDDDRNQSVTFSNPTFRQNFRDPNTPSSIGTPGSTSSRSSYHAHQYTRNLAPNSGLPDLSATMFPSADPFAYPNQPTTEYENVKHEEFNTINTGNRGPPIYVPSGSMNTNVYDDLEGQLFGPIPPYLMQGQQSFDMAQMEMSGMDSMNYGAGITPTTEMNFDAIFSGDDWNTAALDPQFRQ